MKSQAQYSKPPVVEVVSGVIFEPVRGLTIAHYGLFWQRVIKDFPDAKHALPIGLDDTGFPDPFFIPRIWLVNARGGALIQIQGDRFYFNWKEGSASSYTTYPKIFEEFRRLWQAYVDFLGELGLQKPRILKCELTYINHIPQSAGWSSMADLGKVLTSISWRAGTTGFLPSPKTVGWNVTFELPDGKGTLSTKCQPAFRGGDNKELILVLELTAGGPPAEASDAGIRLWFGTAHEWIVRGFEDMTDKGVQQSVWGKR